MADPSRKFWHHFRFLILTCRVRKLRTCAVFILLTTFTFVTYNIISIMGTLGYIEHKEEGAFFNPEHSDNQLVSHFVRVAYRNRWVGFPDLHNISCKKAFTRWKVKNSWFPAKTVAQIPDSRFVSDAAKSCTRFMKNYGYRRYEEVTQEEKAFPVAFIVLFHKDFHQVHLLLRAIYHPHNVYCLVPDAKGQQGEVTTNLIAAARSTASCLPNVFVASKLENITYKGFSRLLADINCMTDLIRHPVRWKYVTNMPGQQFPLKTNLEMVRIFKTFRGANDIEGITGLRTIPSRYKKKHGLSKNNVTGELEMVKTKTRHPTPPHGLRVVKGSAYNTYSRAFVRFVLKDKRVQDVLEWTRDVLSPDEYFWAMVNHNPSLGAPGGFSGVPSAKPHFTVFAVWQGESACATRFVREICILSPADIPLLLATPALFANKFYINHHPSALHCLDQMVFNRTISGYVGDLEPYGYLKFDPSVEMDNK